MIDMSFAFIKVLMAGGLLMLPIILCSLVALAIILERAWFFYQMPSSGKADEMIEWSLRGNSTTHLQSARKHSIRASGVGIGDSLALGRSREGDGSNGHGRVSRMKRGFPSLDTIITLSPLLGLLGTIIG